MNLPDGVVGVVGAEEADAEDEPDAATAFWEGPGVGLDCGLPMAAPPSVDPMVIPGPVPRLPDHFYVSNVSSSRPSFLTSRGDWDCPSYDRYDLSATGNARNVKSCYGLAGFHYFSLSVFSKFTSLRRHFFSSSSTLLISTGNWEGMKMSGRGIYMNFFKYIQISHSRVSKITQYVTRIMNCDLVHIGYM